MQKLPISTVNLTFEEDTWFMNVACCLNMVMNWAHSYLISSCMAKSQKFSIIQNTYYIKQDNHAIILAGDWLKAGQKKPTKRRTGIEHIKLVIFHY